MLDDLFNICLMIIIIKILISLLSDMKFLKYALLRVMKNYTHQTSVMNLNHNH